MGEEGDFGAIGARRGGSGIVCITKIVDPSLLFVCERESFSGGLIFPHLLCPILPLHTASGLSIPTLHIFQPIQIEQTKRCSGDLWCAERRRELFSRANCGTIPYLYWMIDDSSSSSDGRGGTSKLPPFSTSSCATAKKLSVHEPPRWRFINRAKKTEGYSSMAAGYIVKGACIYASSPRFFRWVCWISSLYAESRV